MDLTESSNTEADTDLVSQSEGRAVGLKEEPAGWRGGPAKPQASSNRLSMEGVAGAEPSDTPAHEQGEAGSGPATHREHMGEEEEARLGSEGYFSQHCDTASLSSFSLDTPSLPRRTPPQDDTASLVSTATLVPEAIYLPPAGHQLVPHGTWEALNAQVSELQEEVSRLQAEKAQLEKELDTQTNHTSKQVSLLQAQVQTSEGLLQELQQSFSHSQNTVQNQLLELSLSQKRVCSGLSRLQGEGEGDLHTSPTLLGAHCEERLRIEIVSLREQLDTRAEESEVLEVQLSSLKMETERIQSQKEKLETELHTYCIELQGLRMALSHLQKDNKALINDKAALQQQCLELRSQVISLRSQVDTSQTVQMDFVRLSQSLQVKLEQIRQAKTLEQVRVLLGEQVCRDEPPCAEET